MALTKKQLDHLEKRLLDERARALKALGLFDRLAQADRDSSDSDLSAYTDHMADQGTEAQEREKAAAFATKEGRYLYRLEEALRRAEELAGGRVFSRDERSGFWVIEGESIYPWPLSP